LRDSLKIETDGTEMTSNGKFFASQIGTIDCSKKNVGTVKWLDEANLSHCQLDVIIIIIIIIITDYAGDG